MGRVIMNNQEPLEKRSEYRQRNDRGPRCHRGWKIFGIIVLIIAVVAGIYAFMAWRNVKVTTNNMCLTSGDQFQSCYWVPILGPWGGLTRGGLIRS